MQARPKRRTVNRDRYDARGPRERQIDLMIRTNGLDLMDGTTAAVARPKTTKPVTRKQIADRYALLAEAETRRQYREFRRRQVAFKRQGAGAVA